MVDEHLGQKIYRQVWEHAGGRPWTFIMRDNYKRFPVVWMTVVLFLGILIGHIFWNTTKEDNERYG